MSVTLKPVLQALGLEREESQLAFIKLLQSAGAFGELPGVSGMLDNRQATVILQNVLYDDAGQAADWLHGITQAHMLRPNNVPRHELPRPALKGKPDQIQAALDETGLTQSMTAPAGHYDHTLVLGAMEPTVSTRLDILAESWKHGARFNKITLLGSDRPLDAAIEPSAARGSTEADMLDAQLAGRRANWPETLQRLESEVIDARSPVTDVLPNTRDTVRAWLKTNPKPGKVLIVSSQPHAAYQEAAVKSALPDGFTVTTAAAGVKNVNPAVALDAVARRIDVGLSQLKQKLATSPPARLPLVTVDPAIIKTDPAAYQFRSGGDKNGVTKAHRLDSESWNPVLHGDPLLLHERKDGGLYVVDGHHRLDFAQRLNAQGRGPGEVAALILRESSGYSVKDAKLIAAYKNISRGTCDPVDTARVLKEAREPDVHAQFLPSLQLDKGNLRLSYTLSGLSDASLQRVATGEVSPELAGKVADQVAPPQQDAVMELIGKKLRADPGAQAAPKPGFASMILNKRAQMPPRGLA